MAIKRAERAATVHSSHSASMQDIKAAFNRSNTPFTQAASTKNVTCSQRIVDRAVMISEDQQVKTEPMTKKRKLEVFETSDDQSKKHSAEIKRPRLDLKKHEWGRSVTQEQSKSRSVSNSLNSTAELKMLCSSARDGSDVKTPLHAMPAHPSDMADQQADRGAFADSDEKPLPRELHDLIDLHLSLMKALSLHYAHAGTTSPVDTRQLALSVTKIWTRRAVTILDIRQCLGLLGQSQPDSPSPRPHPLFTLTSDSRSIFLETHVPPKVQTSLARHIDEAELNDSFALALRVHWESHFTPEVAFTSLPLAPITQNTRLRVPAQRALGQRRLEDLRGVVLRATKPTLTTPKTGLQSRTSDLLSKLAAKESLRAAAPAPPTRAELDRTAALQRAEEVAAVLGVGRGRGSWALSALVQNVRDSARSALSPAEVERCLRVLAEEVAPGWVRIVSTGGVVGVVVDGGRRPMDLQERVRTLLKGG